jgi:hypothetical protein
MCEVVSLSDYKKSLEQKKKKRLNSTVFGVKLMKLWR